MNVQQQLQQCGTTTTILSLPAELIAQICSYEVLDTTDLFNLGVSHPKLNNSLFREQNSALWRTKYIQKYGYDWEKNEFEIIIDEQNTWKNEIVARMSLYKAVQNEIVQMPSKYMKFKYVPYHMYPFAEELHSNSQSRQYYVFRATLDFYNQQIVDNSSDQDLHILHVAHQFLIYVGQVYFGYKLKKFLSLPLAEQTIEQGFHFSTLWWSPTNYSSYYDLRNNLDSTASILCDELYKACPTHPMFENGYDFDLLVRNGKSNIDHDLYDEENTLIILNCINDKMFDHYNNMMCPCRTHTINCFALQQVLDFGNGSLFILCVLYESITRRFGIKVNLTATSVHTFVSWTSSWPGNEYKNNTCYLIDITNRGAIRPATVCPVSRKLPELYNRNSVSDLLRKFSKTVEQFSMDNMLTYKYVFDFQKLLGPDDIEVEFRCQQFHQCYGYCPCPLFKTSLNPLAPKHKDEKFSLHPEWEEIFPLVPRRRGTNNDPKYSIGMLIDVSKHFASPTNKIQTNHGVIVGWSKVPNNNTIVYYIYIIYRVTYYFERNFETPIIEAVLEDEMHELRRQLIPNRDFFPQVGKFFKSFSHKLCAFIPIDDLAQRYPDDFIHTVNTETYSS